MRSDKALFYFKLSFVGSLISLFGTFFLTYTLFCYSPELHVISQFYTKGIRESNQQNEIIPFEVEGYNRALFDEMLIRYYIETRYTVIPDPKEMLRRWQPGHPLFSLTTPAIYNQFIGGDLEKKVTKLQNAVSTVDILAVNPDKGIEGKYDVDFDIYTRDPNGQIGLKKKRVTLTIKHGRARNKIDFANPYGTYVDYFSEKTRNN